MSTELQVVPQLTNEQVELIKRNFAKEATDDELKMFIHQCNRTGLDPISRQIYFQKYKNNKTGQSNVTIITGIDGYRIIAARSEKYAGSDDPVFDNEKEPNRATATVYRFVQGQKCAFTATARWNEYCPGPPKDHMWKKMPCTMLGKCAEALALRKAFPNELSGIYIKEEMDQAHGDRIKVSKTNSTQERAVYLGEETDQKGLSDYLLKANVDVELHDAIHKAMLGRDKRELPGVIKSVTDELIFNQVEKEVNND